MGMNFQPTAGSSKPHVGAGVLTCPAERSSANVLSCETVEFEMLHAQASCARPPRWGHLGLRVIALATAFVTTTCIAQAQSSSQTIHRHKVTVDDPSSPPELIQ